MGSHVELRVCSTSVLENCNENILCPLVQLDASLIAYGFKGWCCRWWLWLLTIIIIINCNRILSEWCIELRTYGVRCESTGRSNFNSGSGSISIERAREIKRIMSALTWTQNGVSFLKWFKAFSLSFPLRFEVARLIFCIICAALVCAVSDCAEEPLFASRVSLFDQTVVVVRSSVEIEEGFRPN